MTRRVTNLIALAILAWMLPSPTVQAAAAPSFVAMSFGRCPTNKIVVTWFPKGHVGAGTPSDLPRPEAGRSDPDPTRPHATVWRTGGFAEENWLFYTERAVAQGSGWFPVWSVPRSEPCVGPGPAHSKRLPIAHARSAHRATALKCRLPESWFGAFGTLIELHDGSHAYMRATLRSSKPRITWDTTRCRRIALP